MGWRLRLSLPPELDGSSIKDVGADAESAVENAKSTVECVNDAGIDAAKIQACTK